MNRRTSPMRIVLASASPRRRELLEKLGKPFDVKPAGTDESVDLHTTPVQAIQQIALQKATAVAAADRSAMLVIGADTAVVLGSRILGKPSNRENALAMLRQLRGRTHQVVTGLAIVENPSGNCAVSHTTTAVTMHSYSDRETEEYISSGEPEDKAGAYAIQGAGGRLVESIQGCYFNVVGLPLCELSRMLSAVGFHVPARCYLPGGGLCPRSDRIKN